MRLSLPCIAVLAAAAACAGAVDPDVGKDMVEICISRGYTSIESHYVTTADGYILGVYRLPRGLAGTPGASAAAGKPVVFLQVWCGACERRCALCCVAPCGACGDVCVCRGCAACVLSNVCVCSTVCWTARTRG
jgi:hypothetical protein